MANLAIVESAPTGTQKKSSDSDEWISATVGDYLTVDMEIQNTQSNNYGIGIYAEAGIIFDESGTVTLSNLSGTIKIQTDNNEWVTVQYPGQYTAMGVGATTGGGVSVVCSKKGRMRIKPWSQPT